MSGFQQKFSQQKLILRHIEKIVSLKTLFENLHLVKSYEKTNPTDFVFGQSMGKNTGGA